MLRKMLKKYELTHTQFVVLAGTFSLSQHNESLTQVEIATHIEIDKMMTSNVLRALESRKLITRKEHKTDTRAKTISVTKRGEELLKLSVKEVEEFDTLFFSKLKSQKEFNEELLKLIE